MPGRALVCTLAACLIFTVVGMAQQDSQSSLATTSTANVPRLIRIKGVVRDENGKALRGNIGITFTLYKDENGQGAVWQEIQNVSLDSSGHYSVLLGATEESGLPLEIFAASEARWLGIRPDGQAEQPLTVLLSVPYALKAADAETLGGKPASAFALASGPNSTSLPTAETTTAVAATPTQGESPEAACSSVTSDGTATANQVSKFTSPCNIENSAIFESGGKVGIGNSAPAGVLDVSGSAFVRGPLSTLGGIVVTPTGTATPTQGFVSNPLDIEASLYNTTLSKAASYIYRWESEPVGNDTSSTGATLNLLYGVSGAISETGLSIAKNGIVTFASGQTFPGAGTGTVTSVGTGAGLTGGPITKSGTISIPNGGVANSMLANPSITVQAGSGLSGGGTVALGGTVSLAADLSGTTHGIGYFSSPANLVSTAAPSNGQILIGSTGNAPVLSTLTAGSNITITNNPGSITISASGGGGGPPTLPFFVTGGGRTGGSLGAVKNVTKLWGFLLPYNVTTAKITYDVTTADNSANKYDVGIFNSAGKLLLNLGPTPGTTFAPAKAFQTLTWAQGSTSLPAGKYYLAVTMNCSSACAKIAATTAFVSFAINASAGASSNGTLPGSVTLPTDTWGTGDQLAVVLQ